MALDIRKWLWAATLAGALAVGLAAAGAKAQGRNEPPPGSRADRKEDKRERRQLKLQVEEDNRQLQEDINKFGSHSPQAKADRHRLREDKQRLQALRRDIRHDEHPRERQYN